MLFRKAEVKTLEGQFNVYWSFHFISLLWHLFRWFWFRFSNLSVTCPRPLMWAKVPMKSSYSSSALFKIWKSFFPGQHQFLSKQYEDAMIHILMKHKSASSIVNFCSMCQGSVYVIKVIKRYFSKPQIGFRSQR